MTLIMNMIAFHKMVASGNDFIVIDNREKLIKNPKRFAAKVCPQHVGVGADGVLLIEPSRKADFFMRIINADGSEAEACGNGYRCVGLYAHQLLGFSRSMKVETLAGTIAIEVGKERIRARMANPSEYQEKISLSFPQKRESMDPRLKHAGMTKEIEGVLHVAFINTGVPHVVFFVEDLEGLGQVGVKELGSAIRYHEMFRPRGTNVNFVEVTGKDLLSIRTYERGVEDETLACGTGTVASAVVASLTGKVETPVHVKTQSGETLIVGFERKGNQVRNVFLEGSAKFVFEGRLAA